MAKNNPWSSGESEPEAQDSVSEETDPVEIDLENDYNGIQIYKNAYFYPSDKFNNFHLRE